MIDQIKELFDKAKTPAIEFNPAIKVQITNQFLCQHPVWIEKMFKKGENYSITVSNADNDKMNISIAAVDECYLRGLSIRLHAMFAKRNETMKDKIV